MFTVETGRPPSGTAPLQAVTDLVSGLGNDNLDAASTQMSANGAGRTNAICENRDRFGSRSPDAAPQDPGPCHNGFAGWHVTGLTCGDVPAQ